MGSWNFIIVQSAILAVWVVWNTIAHGHNASHFANLPPGADPDTQQGAWFVWDAYPFVFLNLLLSMVAALQAPIIMMSQNRQAAKDRLAAGLDYEVNLKSETSISELHDKVDRLQAQIEQMVAIQHAAMTRGDEGAGRPNLRVVRES